MIYAPRRFHGRPGAGENACAAVRENPSCDGPALPLMTIPCPVPWLCLLCVLLPSGLAGPRAQETAGERPPGTPPLLIPAGARELRDLPYVKDGAERQRLDLYLPATPAAAGAAQNARPLVIWVHGGGWEGGSKHDCPAKPLLARGYAVASVGYRLSSQAVFPAQIEDCKAAVRWLRAHAGEYGIDPQRIGAWGASAGGQLVALLGTTGGTRRFDVGGDLDQSSAVQCVLDWFGPADFLRWGDPPLTVVMDSPNTALARLLGGPVSTRPELARSASAVYSADKNSAPFLIMHGDHDTTVPLQQSDELATALQKAGVETTFKVVAGAGHGGPAFSQPANLQLMAAFFDRHLHPGT